MNGRQILISAGMITVFFAGCGQNASKEKERENGEVPKSVSSSSAAESEGRKYKIFHIMSYHSPWEWTDDQLRGFTEGLQGLNVELKIFQMDTKRRSTEEWKRSVSLRAIETIGTWKPDLVYTSDDNAQEYVVKNFIDNGIPFVFSAVNADPKEYGFTGSRNITGVLEQEHFIETVGLLREIKPGISRIAVVADEDPTWNGVFKRMKEKAEKNLYDVKFIGWNIIHTFKEYRNKIKNYQETADALALLGIHTLRDENGENVPWQEVLRWTAENSDLPDFSFWKDRVPYGTLCVVYVSGYEQGLAAGRIAYGILSEGKSPSDYTMAPTMKGQPIINLARARKLGISLKSDILLSAKIVEKFAWE